MHQYPGHCGHTCPDTCSGDCDGDTGLHYLQNTHVFNSERDAYSEQIRIDNSSWSLGFNGTLLSDSPQNGWFEITVTNLDTHQNQTYGYGNADNGRTYTYDTYQQYPMYTAGSYQIDMKGNLVGVKITVAKGFREVK